MQQVKWKRILNLVIIISLLLSVLPSGIAAKATSTPSTAASSEDWRLHAAARERSRKRAPGQRGAFSEVASSESSLQVGAAKFDMTPQVDRELGGYGTGLICDVSEDVLDPVYLRVIVIQNGQNLDQRLVFLAPDICTYWEDQDPDSIFPYGTIQRFAQAAQVSVEQVFIMPTHTHQGPLSFNHDPQTEPELYADDQRILNGFVDAVETAVENMQPVNMGVVTSRNDLAVNRRPNYEVARDLPFDNRVLGLKFTAVEDDTPVAFLVNYSCHQTALGNEQPENSDKITTEIIGWGMNRIEEACAEDNEAFVSFFMNGFYGAAGPDIYGEKNSDYETMKRRGIEFGEEILQDFETTATEPFTGTIGYAAAECLMDTTMADHPTHPVQFRAAHIGDDLGVIGVTVEAFAEMGAKIRALSPYENTLIAANCSGFTTYVPTVDAFHDGIGGPEVTDRTVFQENSEQKILDMTMDLFLSMKDPEIQEYDIVGACASESNPYHPAEYAFDGNTRSKWFGQGSSSVWLQADLGASKPVSKVIVDFGDYSRLEVGKAFSLQISDDVNFTNYTTVAVQEENSTGIVAFRFAPVTGRYVRFVCSEAYGNDPNFFPAVYELRVFGESDGQGAKMQAPVIEIPEEHLFAETFDTDLERWQGSPVSAEIQQGKLILTDDTTNLFLTKETEWSDYRFEVDVMPQYNCYFGLVFRAADSDNLYMWQFTTNTLAFVSRIDGAWTQLKPYIQLPVRLQADTAADILRHISIEVCGGTIKTYLDGVLVDVTVDFAHTSGGVGFWTNGAMAIDNVSVSNLEPLLTETFENLDHWNVTNGSGMAGVSQNILTLGAGDVAFSKSGADWENYSFAFDVEAETSYLGARFRIQENGDDYLWWIGNQGPELVKRIGGGWEPIGTQYVDSLNPATAHHVEIYTRGQQLQVWVDGILYNEASDSSLETGGVGFLVDASSAEFSNVLVQDLGAVAPVLPDHVLLQDDFTKDLSLWNYDKAEISGGVLTLQPGGTVVSKDGGHWDDYSYTFDLDCCGSAYRGARFRVQENGDDYFWWIGGNGPELIKRINGGWEAIGVQHITELDFSSTHHVEIRAVGSTLEVYVDGVLCTSATDDALPSGGVGLFADGTSANFADVQVTRWTAPPEEGEILLEDTFSDDLNAWSSQLAQITPDGRLQLGDPESATLNAYAISNAGSSWDNYAIEFDADFSECYYRGISFRRQANGDDYLWWFGNESGGTQIIKRVGGGWQVISDTKEPLALNGMHHFKIVVNNASFYTYIDGELCNTGFDTGLTNGGIMLFVNYNAAYFDNLVVTSIATE